MLPYTTYNIPENTKLIAPDSDKWLWIIVDQELTAEDNELLAKISAALNADFSLNVHCVQLDPGQSISLAETDLINPELIISFGVTPSSLGLWIDLSKPGLLTLERFRFILTTPLSSLASSTSAKKALWGSMQEFMETRKG